MGRFSSSDKSKGVHNINGSSHLHPGLEHESSVESGGRQSAGPEPEQEAEVLTKKPGMVALPDDATVMQIDCGTFHSGEGGFFLIWFGHAYTWQVACAVFIGLYVDVLCTCTYI